MKRRVFMCTVAAIIIAGILLLLESLIGCIYVLGLSFSNLRDVFTGLILTMAFPIYLLTLYSVRTSAVSLWTFFGLQWANACIDKVPPGLVNPLGWIHGELLFTAAILLTGSALWMDRSSKDLSHLGLRDVLRLHRR